MIVLSHTTRELERGEHLERGQIKMESNKLPGTSHRDPSSSSLSLCRQKVIVLGNDLYYRIRGPSPSLSQARADLSD